MTDRKENIPKATTQRLLTLEQREQQNLRARQRRAAAKAAKATGVGTTNYADSAFSPTVPYTVETSPGTIGHQQSLRDRPFQHQLSNSLQAQDKARTLRILYSQERQVDQRINKES